jgi:5'-3' exonuclease
MIKEFNSLDDYVKAVIAEYPQMSYILQLKKIHVPMITRDIAVLIFKYGGCKNIYLEEETRRQLLNLEMTGKAAWGKEAWKREG